MKLGLRLWWGDGGVVGHQIIPFSSLLRRLPRTGGLHPWLAHPRRSLKSQGSGVEAAVGGVKQGQRLPSWVLPPAIKGEPRFCQWKYHPCRNVGSWNDLNSIFFLLLDNHLSLVYHFWRAERNTTLWFDSSGPKLLFSLWIPKPSWSSLLSRWVVFTQDLPFSP